MICIPYGIHVKETSFYIGVLIRMFSYLKARRAIFLSRHKTPAFVCSIENRMNIPLSSMIMVEAALFRLIKYAFDL